MKNIIGYKIKTQTKSEKICHLVVDVTGDYNLSFWVSCFENEGNKILEVSVIEDGEMSDALREALWLNEEVTKKCLDV